MDSTPWSVFLKLFDHFTKIILLLANLLLKQMQFIKRNRPNIENLNPVVEPPKTESNWTPAQISKHWIQFQVEPTMFEPRLKFEKRFKNSASDNFFKILIF